MKGLYFLGFTSIILAFAACTTTYSGGITTENVTSISSSNNKYDLVISDQNITHTISITTNEGRAKLYKKTIDEAKALVYQEAVQKYGCDRIFDPKYTAESKGRKKVIYISVYGKPANYKNRANTPNGSSENIIYVK